MKKLNIIISLLISLSFYTNATASTDSKWNYKKVQSVNECSECHEDEAEVWKDTKHAKTFKKFSQNKDAKKIAKKMGVKRIKKADTLCTSCHYTVGSKRGKKKVVSGISCESCHSPSADWIDGHSDFGGKGVKKNQETAAHKKERYANMQKLGMIRPDNIYGWAKNCYNCHIVAKEKLVNKGGHKAGSKFKLFKRSQDKIRHTDKATGKKAELIKLIGYAVELEMSLAAVGEASGGNKYSDKMIERAKNALANLKKANASIKRPEITTVIAIASSANIAAGNASGLNPVSAAISVAARIAVEDEMNYRYAKLDRSKLKQIASAKPAAKPKAVKKAKPAPVARKAPPQPKPVAKARPTPAPAVRAAPPRQAPPVRVAKATQPAAARQGRNYSRSKLIAGFDLLSPRNNSMCNTLNPWMLGEKIIKGNDQLGDNACVGLSINPSNDGWLYLFAESKNGELMRMLPNSCNAMTLTSNQVRRGNITNVPLDKNAQESVLNLKDYPGITGFYAVVVDTRDAKNIVDQQTNNIADICSKSPSAGDLQDTLAQLINQTEGHLDWKYQRFYRQ